MTAQAPRRSPDALRDDGTPDTPAEAILEQANGSLLELVDHVLNKGVVLSGEVMLGVADVDLVYLRLAAVLCAADRLLPAGLSTGARKKAAEPSLKNGASSLAGGMNLGRPRARKLRTPGTR